jgi:O-methyltransferase involved in polyketide biosynthesis
MALRVGMDRSTPCGASVLGLSLPQVVVLGAGMDTRPWRLQLPPGVAWFEVDRHDVIAAKQQLLQRHGAATVQLPR